MFDVYNSLQKLSLLDRWFENHLNYLLKRKNNFEAYFWLHLLSLMFIGAVNLWFKCKHTTATNLWQHCQLLKLPLTNSIHIVYSIYFSSLSIMCLCYYSYYIAVYSYILLLPLIFYNTFFYIYRRNTILHNIKSF